MHLRYHSCQPSISPCRSADSLRGADYCMAANAQLLYADLAAPTHSGSRDRPPTLHGQRRSRSNISHIHRGTLAWRQAYIHRDTANATARAAYLSQGVRRRTHLSHKIRLLRPESKIARPPHSQITFHSPACLHSRSHVLILIIASSSPSSSSSPSLPLSLSARCLPLDLLFSGRRPYLPS